MRSFAFRKQSLLMRNLSGHSFSNWIALPKRKTSLALVLVIISTTTNQEGSLSVTAQRLLHTRNFRSECLWYSKAKNVGTTPPSAYWKAISQAQIKSV